MDQSLFEFEPTRRSRWQHLLQNEVGMEAIPLFSIHASHAPKLHKGEVEESYQQDSAPLAHWGSSHHWQRQVYGPLVRPTNLSRPSRERVPWSVLHRPRPQTPWLVTFGASVPPILATWWEGWTKTISNLVNYCITIEHGLLISLDVRAFWPVLD